MKKLFISQPMKGKTDEEILKEREKAIASAKRNFAESEEIEVIDSFSRALLRMRDLCGFWENLWNCFLRQTLHILQKAGKTQEDVASKILAPLSTELL